MNRNIRKAANEQCVSVWLDLRPKEIFQRIKRNKRRPLLSIRNSEKDVQKLCEKRKKTYSLSNYRVDCNLKTKREIVKELLKIYENI